MLMLCDGRRAVGGRRAARGAGPGAGPTARPEPAAGTCQPEPLAPYVLIYVITPQTTYDSTGVRRAPPVWASLYTPPGLRGSIYVWMLVLCLGGSGKSPFPHHIDNRRDL